MLEKSISLCKCFRVCPAVVTLFVSALSFLRFSLPPCYFQNSRRRHGHREPSTVDLCCHFDHICSWNCFCISPAVLSHLSAKILWLGRRNGRVSAGTVKTTCHNTTSLQELTSSLCCSWSTLSSKPFCTYSCIMDVECEFQLRDWSGSPITTAYSDMQTL